MTHEALNVMKEWLAGLTMEEWEVIKPEVDQHFGVKSKRISLDALDVREITRTVAMRMDMYQGAAEAVSQTKLSL